MDWLTYIRQFVMSFHFVILLASQWPLYMVASNSRVTIVLHLVVHVAVIASADVQQRFRQKSCGCHNIFIPNAGINRDESVDVRTATGKKEA